VILRAADDIEKLAAVIVDRCGVRVGLVGGDDQRHRVMQTRGEWRAGDLHQGTGLKVDVEGRNAAALRGGCIDKGHRIVAAARRNTETECQRHYCGQSRAANPVTLHATSLTSNRYIGSVL